MTNPNVAQNPTPRHWNEKAQTKSCAAKKIHSDPTNGLFFKEMQVLLFQLLEFLIFSSLMTMKLITVGVVLSVLSLFVPSSGSVFNREQPQAHSFNSTYRKVVRKHPYIKAQPEDTNQEPCYCIGYDCFSCPYGMFCSIDRSGCCPTPGCHGGCGDICVCPDYPICCYGEGTCPLIAPVCCDFQSGCCPLGTDCCGPTLCCNRMTEYCCVDSSGWNFYCGYC